MNELVRALRKSGIVEAADHGVVADKWVDIKLACGDPVLINMMGDGLLGLINDNSLWGLPEDERITGIALPKSMAGLVLAGNIAAKYKPKNEKYKLKITYVRKKKPVRLQKWVEGEKNFTTKDRILLIDGVFWTGATMGNLREKMSSYKCQIVGAAVVVQRDKNYYKDLILKSLIETEYSQ